jgi:hypothetical protein
MATIELQNLEETKKALEDLAREMPNVAVRAINKSLKEVKTDIKAIVRAGYNYKLGALDKRMTPHKATRARIEGSIVSKGGAVHLTDILETKKLKAGVQVNVKKSTPAKVIPRTFIAQGQRSGKKIVFRRVGDPPGQHARLVGRRPIEAFYAGHPEVIMNTTENWAKIQTAAATRLDTNITRETDAEFRRIEGKW